MHGSSDGKLAAFVECRYQNCITGSPDGHFPVHREHASGESRHSPPLVPSPFVVCLYFLAGRAVQTLRRLNSALLLIYRTTLVFHAIVSASDAWKQGTRRWLRCRACSTYWFHSVSVFLRIFGAR